MKYGGGMNELPYPSDLTAAQWALIEPLLPAPKPKGRKRHIVVDVLGLILAVAVTGANVQDRDGGQLVLQGLKDRFPRPARVWADGVYAGRLVEWAEKTAQFFCSISFA